MTGPATGSLQQFMSGGDGSKRFGNPTFEEVYHHEHHYGARSRPGQGAYGRGMRRRETRWFINRLNPNFMHRARQDHVKFTFTERPHGEKGPRIPILISRYEIIETSQVHGDSMTRLLKMIGADEEFKSNEE